MQPFTTHTGLIAVMDRSNVDTDQIIPKQFLKRIERTGFGQFLFFDWRFADDGALNPDFELNAGFNLGASILVSRRNFGSGSSREHAVWALADYGFRCVIAESYSDIFYNNCFKNGVLPIILDAEHIQRLMECKTQTPDYHLTVDLPAQIVTGDQGLQIPFDIDPIRKDSLVRGLDDIGQTLQLESRIAEYEAERGFPPVN